ncbi:hypothetical protein IAT40_003577 [Kwoniella sp. CBS 6097]
MVSSSPDAEHPPAATDAPGSPLPLPIPDTPQSSTPPSQSSTRPASPVDDPADKIAPQQELPDCDHEAPKENISRAPSPSVQSIYSSRNRQHETPAGAPMTDEELARRPDLLKVHWKSRLRDHHVVDMGQSTEPEDADDDQKEKRQVRRMASRLVRKHTGRPPPTAISDTDSDSDHTNVPSSSAASLHSTGSAGSPPKRRRQSSGRSSMSSGWASTDDGSTDEDTHVSGGGVLSALLGLYRSETRSREKGTLRGLMRGQDGEYGYKGRVRRRWSSQSLFATASASSSITGSRRGSGDFDEGLAADELQERLQHESKRVHRNRRHQSLPHRSQDLNQPYIPSPKYSNVLHPPPNITIVQKLRQFMSSHALGATWFGYPTDQQGFEGPGPEGSQRAFAALLITTSSLVAAASPTLAHVAPAAGVDAETTDGKRKVSWYEGLGEGQAREEDSERREDEALGSTRETDLEKGLGPDNLKIRGKRRRRRGKRVQKELAVTKHVTSIIQRKKFIEMLAKAVVSYGAPAHSVEAWLSATADILQVEASFIYFPSILIVAFRDSDVHSTDVLFIRPSGALELYRLSLVHEVYRRVIHDEISASQGCRVLRRIERRTTPYSRLCLILAAAVASATSARVAFSGSFIDILLSGALGSLLAIVQFTIAEKNKLVANIFEIGMAGILSFAARGLGSTSYFCYQSLASAAIVLILPGWHVCMGALELGSKNIVAGAIRLVWAVVYTLFLSLGLGIGSEIWDAFGPSQPSENMSSTPSMATIEGSFTSNNTYWDQTFNNGTFTFTNGSSTTEQATNVACYRNPDWTYWWYTEPSDWWLFLLVPLFAFSLAVWFRADYRSKDMLVMVIVACAGYVVNFFLTDQIDQSNVVSAVSAFTLGILGNLYSRLGGGSAFPSMVVGILLLVPNAIAAAGGLSASSSGSSSQDNASNMSGGSSSSEINAAVVVSIRMVQVGIGLAIGLFAAAAVVYPFGKKRRYIFSY